MPFELFAPEHIQCGDAIVFGFTSDTRVSGRVRLTLGTEALPFKLDKDGTVSELGTGHRLRGKSGSCAIVEWGDHPAGTELVLRFEGKKIWMTVG